MNGLIKYSGNVSYIYELLNRLKLELELNNSNLDNIPNTCYDLVEMVNQEASSFFKSMSNLVIDGILKIDKGDIGK